MANRELDKVRLESESEDETAPVDPEGEVEDSADEDYGIPKGDYESDVSEAEDQEEYNVDAITYAEFRDSRKPGDRGKNGWRGWHYHVMWSGYLKAGSDSEEGKDQFGEGSLLPEFWATYKNGLDKGKKEPKGVPGDVHVPPDWLLKRWFSQTVPKRSYNAFCRRRERLSRQITKIRKTDSDYYINKARQARAAAEEKGEVDKKTKKKKKSSAGDGGGDLDAAALEAKAKRKAERKAAKREVKRKEQEAAERAELELRVKKEKQSSPLPQTVAAVRKVKLPTALLESPSPKINAVAGPGPSTLASQRNKIDEPTTDKRRSPSPESLALLDSDNEVDSALGGQTRQVRESSEVQEEIEMPVLATQGASKRKRILSSPAPPDRVGSDEVTAVPKKKKKKPPAGGIDTGGTESIPPAPASASLNSASSASTSISKADRLAAMGKIPKRIDIPDPDLVIDAPATSQSDAFGLPQAGIFEPEEEEEVQEEIEQREDLFTAASDHDSLFGDDDAEGEEEEEQSTGAVQAKVEAAEETMNGTEVAEEDSVKTVIPDTAGLPSKPTATHVNPVMKTLSLKPISIAPSRSARSAPTIAPTQKSTQSSSASQVSKLLAGPSSASSASAPAVTQPAKTSLTQAGSSSIAGSSGAIPSSSGATTSRAIAAPVRPPPAPSTSDPAVRPKYVQPTRLKVMDGLADPEVNKQAKRLGRQASPTGQVHMHRALQGTMGGISPVHPLNGGQSPVHYSSIPAQSTSMLNVPTGPSRSTSSYVPRQAPNGPAAPSGPRGWTASSYLASIRPPVPPTGPANMTGGVSPLQQQQPGAGQSPIWQQNTPAQIPIVTPVYNAANDPRRARSAVSAQFALPSPPPPPPDDPLPLPPAPAPSDPRRPSTAQNPQVSPYAPTAFTLKPSIILPTGPRPDPETIASCRIMAPLYSDYNDCACPIKLQRGTPSASYRELSLQGFLNRDRNLAVYCEVLDSFCLSGQFRHGAFVMEWARVILGDSEGKRDFELIKKEVMSETKPKILAAYTETSTSRVDRHYAIVIASAKSIGFDEMKLDRGMWQASELDMVALLVSLPLDSEPAPILPNPVNPDIETRNIKPHPPLTGLCELPDSYGLTTNLWESFASKAVQYRPSHLEGKLDDFLNTVHRGFKKAGVKPIEDGKLDTLLIENNRLYSAVRSMTMANCIPRRTAIMTMGPSLSLFPSQWKVRSIWSTGGLVTFSPTFILRSPDKFAEIVRIIRPAGSWAAYVIPAVIEWANGSWNEPARCPDPTKTFETLTRTLFLDQHLLRFSGSAASSGGGLAISITPPSVHQPELCLRWMSWLNKITDQTDFSALVELCRGVRPGNFDSIKTDIGNDKKGSASFENELELIDIEQNQIEDLLAMRMRPDLLPYRRYIYVGEMSLDKSTRDRVAGRGVEFVSPDDFVAVFSGAV